MHGFQSILNNCNNNYSSNNNNNNPSGISVVFLVCVPVSDFLDYVFLHSSLIITYLHTGHRISCSSSGSDENCPFYADVHSRVCVTHLCGLKCMIISVSRICRSEKPRVNKWYIFWWFCSILSLVLFKINATYTAFFKFLWFNINDHLYCTLSRAVNIKILDNFNGVLWFFFF